MMFYHIKNGKDRHCFSSQGQSIQMRCHSDGDKRQKWEKDAFPPKYSQLCGEMSRSFKEAVTWINCDSMFSPTFQCTVWRLFVLTVFRSDCSIPKTETCVCVDAVYIYLTSSSTVDVVTLEWRSETAEDRLQAVWTTSTNYYVHSVDTGLIQDIAIFKCISIFSHCY